MSYSITPEESVARSDRAIHARRAYQRQTAERAAKDRPKRERALRVVLAAMRLGLLSSDDLSQ